MPRSGTPSSSQVTRAPLPTTIPSSYSDIHRSIGDSSLRAGYCCSVDLLCPPATGHVPRRARRKSENVSTPRCKGDETFRGSARIPWRLFSSRGAEERLPGPRRSRRGSFAPSCPGCAPRPLPPVCNERVVWLSSIHRALPQGVHSHVLSQFPGRRPSLILSSPREAPGPRPIEAPPPGEPGGPHHAHNYVQSILRGGEYQ